MYIITLLATIFLSGWPLNLTAKEGVESEESFVDPFAKTYLTLALARNFPIAKSQRYFEAGYFHPVIGYRHRLKDDWLMGVSGQFRILKRKETQNAPTDEVAILTLTHETYRTIRMYHPTYVLLGTKIHYLLPTRAAILPLQRTEDFEMEIGGGLSLGFARLLDGGQILMLRLDRWRGTKTMKLHGLEIAIGWSVPI